MVKWLKTSFYLKNIAITPLKIILSNVVNQVISPDRSQLLLLKQI